ncbi:TIGR00282 family metallophosphoesterase [Chloroflexota bacterium]
MRILMVGDVVGRPGRRAVRLALQQLRPKHSIDLVIANGENAAGGIGLTTDTADELFRSGVDVITSGNHIWHHKDIFPYLDGMQPILRPLNLPPGTIGQGYLVIGQVMVVSLLGRVFIGNFECPFRTMDRLLDEVNPLPPIIIVDFHAEATAEKVALGWYLDGRVSAVAGTHTHVGTIDARVLPKGMAYVSDIGMAGAVDSVIGDDIDSVIRRFLTMMPHRLSVAKGNMVFNSVLLDVEEESGTALSISRIDLEFKE